MDYKEILSRLGYVRNHAKLSACALSARLDKSPQYIAQIENGRIALTVERLLQILEVCNFPVVQFFSPNIAEYIVDQELQTLIQNLPINKKKNMIEFLKQ